jgi:hypothetical protein
MEKNKNATEISAELGMTTEDYMAYLANELNFIECQSIVLENKHHTENTYTTEKEFIEFNLEELQKFLGIGDIKPLGKYSSEIMFDILYRSIPNISKDIVRDIISYYKIIDIKDVYDKFSARYAQNVSTRTSSPNLTCYCKSCSFFNVA